MGYQPDLAGRRVDRLNDEIRRSFITGIALTVPLIVTLLVIGFVHDIDMSVEQGMRAIMTSGVATDPRTERGELTPEEIVREFEGGVDPEE